MKYVCIVIGFFCATLAKAQTDTIAVTDTIITAAIDTTAVESDSLQRLFIKIYGRTIRIVLVVQLCIVQ
jgi:hypothetical protein